MTVQTNDRRKEYLGNGAARVFDGPSADAASEISIYLVTDNTPLLVSPGQYTISGLGDARTSISLETPPGPGSTLIILRTIPYDQQLSITNQGRFLPETMERSGFDRLAKQIQQLADRGDRTLRYDDNISLSSGMSSILPVPAALSPLVWNAAANKLENGDPNKTGDMMIRPDLASPAAGKGGDLVSFLQRGTGAVARTAQDKMTETVSALDYMSTAQIADVRSRTGLIDVTSAIQAAIDALPAAGGALYFPAGLYLLTASLTITNKTVVIHGDGMNATILKWTGAGMAGQNGINFSHTSQVPFVIRGVSLVAVPNAASPSTLAGVAVNVSYPSQLTVFEPTIRLEKVYIRPDFSGNTWNPTILGGWTKCVYAAEAGNPNFTDCLFVCNTNANVTYGVHLYSSSNPVYPVLNACNFAGFYKSIYTSGPASIGGLVLSDSNFVGVNVAIDIGTASDMFSMNNTYIQAYSYGVRSLARTTLLNSNRIDMVDDPRARYAPASADAVILGNGAANVDSSILTANKFGGSATAPKVGIRCTNGVRQSMINANVFGDDPTYGTAYGTGVIFETGADNNTATNNRKCNCTNLIQDNGATNVVRDNLPVGMMPVSGSFPVLRSGAGNVAMGKLLNLTQTGATIVLGMTGGYSGQEITLVAGDANSTIQNNVNFRLNGGVNFAMGSGATLTLQYDGAVWRETARST